MRTIWLVTQGAYDSYEVVGVFTSKKKAEAFLRDNPPLSGMAKLGGAYAPEIERYILNPKTREEAGDIS